MHWFNTGVFSFASDNRVTVNVDRWRRNQRNIFENFVVNTYQMFWRRIAAPIWKHSFVQKTLRKRPAGSNIAGPSIWQAIPYIANTSEAFARLLKPHGIGVAHRPAGNFRSRLKRIKDRIDPIEKSSVIYRAQDCSSDYTRQISRRLATRIKEHRSAISYFNIKAFLMA